MGLIDETIEKEKIEVTDWLDSKRIKVDNMTRYNIAEYLLEKPNIKSLIYRLIDEEEDEVKDLLINFKEENL